MPRLRFIVLLGVCLSVVSVRAYADSLPRIRVLNPQENVRPMAMEVPAKAYAERAPFVLVHDGRLRYLIGTNRTDVFDLRPGRSVLTDADALVPRTRFRPVYGEIRRDFPQRYVPPEKLENKYWRWIYYGINSAHVIRHPKTGEPCVVGITHGENKNFHVAPRGGNPEFWYENTVLPPPDRTYRPYEYHSGGKTPEVEPRDVRETYSGFVGMIWYSLNEDEPVVHDLGPIVWPPAGYLDADGNLTGKGIRHPSSIIHDGYFYVYYQNHSPLDEPGKEAGLKLARTPLDKLFDARAFRNYFVSVAETSRRVRARMHAVTEKTPDVRASTHPTTPRPFRNRDSFDGSFGQLALPDGFYKEEPRAFFSRPGGRAATLETGQTPEVGRMHVAKLKDTPYFLGVIGRASSGAYLHLSEDLVHWSAGVHVPGTDDPEVFRKPIPVDRDYANHHEIDPTSFYLVDSTRGEPCFRYTSIELVDTSN